MPEHLRPETSIALSSVRAGLRIALERDGAEDVRFKGERDVVTATDVAVEDAVRRSLARTGLPVIGEERGGEAPTAGAHWLVDPICGTRNFASGTPLFCVNVALVEDGIVGAAVVGDPTSTELLCAERDRGAWAVSGNARRRLAVDDGSQTVVVDDSKSKEGRRKQAAGFVAEVIRRDQWDFRSVGTSLALPWVADARASAYAVFEIPGLHGAPGMLLVAEAGGVVTDIDGAPWTLQSRTMLAAASQRLHAELLTIADAARE